jgi:replicative DNA helicase
MEYLQAEDFYRPAHKTLFKAMMDLNSRGEAIDTVTIKAELGSYEPIGGVTYLAQIVNSVPTSNHIENYAKIVAKKAQLRSIIASLTESVGSAYAEELSVEDLIAKAESSLLAVSQSSHRSSFRRLYDILNDHQEKLDERASQTSLVTGTATGYPDFDRLTTGLHEDNLIILVHTI